MFVELNSALNFERDELCGQFVVISEANCDAGFLLHHLTSAYLKHDLNICLIGFSQSFNHYNSVANKLGVSLTTMKERGKLIFVEALKAIGQITINKCVDSLDQPLADEHSHVHDHWNCVLENTTLKPIYTLLKALWQQLPEVDKSPSMLIIDDVSALLNLGTPVKDVLKLIQYLRMLICPSPASRGCLTVCAPTDKDDEAQLLHKHLCHQSNLVLRVSGLESGFCRDVHGELTITWRDLWQNRLEGDKVKKMQFKLSDKNLSLFAVGTSAAVL